MVSLWNVQSSAHRLKHTKICLMPDEKLFSCPVFLSLGARLFEEIARFADRKHLHAVAILDDVAARPDRDVMLAGRIGIKAARGYFRWRRNAGRNNGRGSRV